MGYGNTNVSEKSGIFKHGAKMGGGVKLAHGTKKEDTGGGMDLNQKKVMEGDYNPVKSGGIHSGGESKGNFMATPRYKGTAKSKEGLYSPTKTLSKKQSEVFDGADGSKKNNEIEGTEVAAVSKK